MSKTSLLIGCVMAAAMHGLLLFPMPASPAEEPKPDEAPPKTTLVTAPRPEPPVPAPPVPAPPVPAPPVPKPVERPVEPPKPPEPAPKPKPPLEKVAEAPAQPKSERPDPADASADVDDKALPPMRIAWTSPGQVRTVARTLGLRIVAVNADQQAVGEIDPYDGKFRDFTGRLDQYSNRVRTLGRGFFATSPDDTGDRDVARFWILVPAAVDRQWIALQRSAIAERGMTAGQVREVEARFTGSDGSLRLSITRVHGRREAGGPNPNKET